MNFNYIEDLVKSSKAGNEIEKEKLVEEFTPLILNLSKKSFINSYEYEDIRSECFRTLFKCVDIYKMDKHRFVAYATNAIKNSVNYLIRVSVRRDSSEGSTALIFDGTMDSLLPSTDETVDDIILSKVEQEKLRAVIGNLNYLEKDLVSYVYFRNFSLKKYSLLKDIPYPTVLKNNKSLLKKLRLALNSDSKTKFFNIKQTWTLNKSRFVLYC